jgi:hypothetical protein
MESIIDCNSIIIDDIEMPDILPQCHNIKKIIFTDVFNQQIKYDILPPNLEIIVLGKSYHQPIDLLSLPVSLTGLFIGEDNLMDRRDNIIVKTDSGYEYQMSHFNNEMISNFDNSEPLINSIVFGYMFNKPIMPDTLSIYLTEIYFGKSFNCQLFVHSLPPNLVLLSFGDNYDQPINPDVLPSSLQYLFFGNNFNQLIKSNVLPINLRYLSFGDKYNQPLDILPSSLRTIVFGDNFNQDIIPGILPEKLFSIVFGKGYQKEFTKNSLPSGLLYLTVDKDYPHQLGDNLPKYLFSVNYGNSQSKNLELEMSNLDYDYDFNEMLQTISSEDASINYCHQIIKSFIIILLFYSCLIIFGYL